MRSSSRVNGRVPETIGAGSGALQQLVDLHDRRRCRGDAQAKGVEVAGVALQAEDQEQERQQHGDADIGLPGEDQGTQQ